MSTPEEIQADIDRQRAHLADTVDQLAARLDVKTRAKNAAAEWKQAATNPDGRPKPTVVAGGAGVVAFLTGWVLWRRRR